MTVSTSNQNVQDTQAKTQPNAKAVEPATPESKTNWWLWGGVGVAAIGLGIGAYYLLSGDDASDVAEAAFSGGSGRRM